MSKHFEIGPLLPPSVIKPNVFWLVLTSSHLIDNSTIAALSNSTCATITRPLLCWRSRKFIDTGKFSQQLCFRKRPQHGTSFTWFWEGGVLGGQGHIPVRIMTIGGMSSKIQWSLKAAPGLHHCTVMPIISLQQNYDDTIRNTRPPNLFQSALLASESTFLSSWELSCIEIYILWLVVDWEGGNSDDGGVG